VLPLVKELSAALNLFDKVGAQLDMPLVAVIGLVL
jgi:hypothetical protein